MANSIPKSINNIRTMEEVAHMLSILYTNLNYLDGIYYDMFINPVPMDLELKRYDETGKLVTVVVPNRAKDILATYSGSGNPNGVQIARVGALYVDTLSAALYYKGSGSDSYGWILIWSAANFAAGQEYLTPDGNGSQIKDINASNITSGTLSVSRGGTGAKSLTGLVKANGTNPFTAAIDGEDYVGAESMTGVVAYYPVDVIPKGWLKCDGAAYSRTTYSRLFKILGETYGAGDGATTFNVPDLRNHFVRCWDGVSAFNTVQEDQVGSHSHKFSGSTGAGTPHTHTRGTMNITGGYNSYAISGAPIATANHSGCFTALYNSGAMMRTETRGYYPVGARMDASRSWTGVSSAEAEHTHTLSGMTEENTEEKETRVLNKMMVPIIKY